MWKGRWQKQNVNTREEEAESKRVLMKVTFKFSKTQWKRYKRPHHLDSSCKNWLKDWFTEWLVVWQKWCQLPASQTCERSLAISRSDLPPCNYIHKERTDILETLPVWMARCSSHGNNRRWVCMVKTDKCDGERYHSLESSREQASLLQLWSTLREMLSCM